MLCTKSKSGSPIRDVPDQSDPMLPGCCGAAERTLWHKQRQSAYHSDCKASENGAPSLEPKLDAKKSYHLARQLERQSMGG